MTARFLLDSNVLSEPMRDRPNERVLERMRINRANLATASVVWHELRFGCERLVPSRKRDKIAHYLDELARSTLPFLPYDVAAALWHARERARLAREGRPAPFADGQIAAIARVNGLVLVTGNVSDFEAFEGLRVEDWSA